MQHLGYRGTGVMTEPAERAWYEAMLRSKFGTEFYALSDNAQSLLMRDCREAYEEDQVGVGAYQKRIGRGNLAAYVACLCMQEVRAARRLKR
jgi:hypothetical protein